MARTEGNIFVDGFRCKVGGNMVFRKRKSGRLIDYRHGLRMPGNEGIREVTL